jgi:glutamate-1-semialdehyde aminotransferase
MFPAPELPPPAAATLVALVAQRRRGPRLRSGRVCRFFGAMLDRGVLLPPSQFEAWFLGAAHGEGDIAATLEAARAAFRA